MPVAPDPPPARRSSLLDRKTSVAALGLAALLLLLALAVGKFLQAARVAGLSAELRTVESAEHRLNDAEARTLAMQSAQRSFVLTGDEEHSHRFEDEAGAALRDLGRLRESISGDPDLRALVAGVEAVQALTGDLASRLRESIAAARGQPEVAELRTPEAVERQAMAERTRAALKALRASINERFAIDSQALTQSLGLAQRIEALMLVGAMASLLAALALARRQAVRRESSLADLDAAHAGLEQEVQRRTAELDLALTRYRSLVELSEDAILICGPDRIIRYANPAALALFRGLGHPDAVGHRIDALLAPDRRDALLRSLDALAQGGPRLGFVATALAGAAGQACPVELAAAAIGEVGSGDRQTLVVLHDLRAQAAQQAALREQVDFVEHLLDALPLPLSLHDGQGRIVRVNRAFEALHEVGRGALVGRRVSEVLPAEQAASLGLGPADVGLPAGAAVEHEAAWRGAKGQEHVVQVRQEALRRADGSSLGVISVQTEVTALRAQERELREHRDRLGALASQLIAAQESERRHVARDLHDQVGQILTALHMQLAARNTGAAAGTLDAPLELAEEALRHTRDLTSSLHPHLLDNLGLQVALDWLLDRFVRPTLGEVEFSCELAPPRADPVIELVAFRVVQEALTNVVRHAEASCAEVSLRTGEGWMRLDVADDGEGFTAGDTWFDNGRRTSLGVAGMRERVEDLGGAFDIESAPGMGTRLRVLLPWPSLAAAAGGSDAGSAG